MATITHAFVSPKIEGGDSSIVGANEWNAEHVITGVFNPSGVIDVVGEGYAVDPTGVTDSTSGIQAAINDSLNPASLKYHSVVYLAPGQYKTTDTIQVGWGYTVQTVLLIGAGTPGADPGTGTWLFPTFVDRPVVNIQGVRQGGIENIAIQGPTQIFNPSNRTYLGRATLANYIPAGAATDICAPYCAVAVDAYSMGSIPPDVPYPLPNKPAYLGGGPVTYGRLASSNPHVINCLIQDTYIGVAVCTNGRNNADFLDCSKTRITRCAYGVTIGTSNCRVNDWSNMNFNGVHTMFDNFHHSERFARGTGNYGNVSGRFQNIHSNECYQIFQLEATWGSSWVVTNFYSEHLMRIGSWGTSSGQEFSFVGCNFEITNNTASSGVLIDAYHDNTIAGPASYIGCTIIAGYGAMAFTAPSSFIRCYFVSDGSNRSVACPATEKAAATPWGQVLMWPSDVRYMNTLTNRFEECRVNSANVYDGLDRSGTEAIWWSVGMTASGSGGAIPYLLPSFMRGGSGGAAYTNRVMSGRSFTSNAATASTFDVVGDVILIIGSGGVATWLYCESVTDLGGGTSQRKYTAFNNWYASANDGGTNLLSYSEEQDKFAFWNDGNSCSITANDTTDVRGDSLADALVENNDDSPAHNHWVGTNKPVAISDTIVTVSWEVKPGTRTWCALELAQYPFFDNDISCYYNLAGAGTVGTLHDDGPVGTSTDHNATITLLTGGWYRITLTANLGASSDHFTNFCIRLFVAEADLDVDVVATPGDKSFWIGGVQMETASAFSSYNPQTFQYTLLDDLTDTGRTVYSWPINTMYAGPSTDAWVTQKGSSIVKFVDSTGAAKNLPVEVTTASKPFWFHPSSLDGIKPYMPFDGDAFITSVSSQSITMQTGGSAVARYSGVFPYCSGIPINRQVAVEGRTIIASGSLSGTSVSITNIPPSFSYLILQVSGASSGSTEQIQVQVDSDNGASYDTTAGNYVGVKRTGTTFTATTTASLVESADWTAAQTGTVTLNIYGYQGGPNMTSKARILSNTVEYETNMTFIGTTSAINAIKILMSTGGTFDAGTYTLYGMR